MSKKLNKDWDFDFENNLFVKKKKSNEMLDEYFMTFELNTCKQILWVFLRETMTGDFPENTTRMERDKIFHFYGYTIGLLEVMNKKYKKRLKQKSNNAG